MVEKRKKFSCAPLSKKQQRNDGQTFRRRAEPTATLSTKRRGAQPARAPCGVVASRLPSGAETKHCWSGTRAVHKQPMQNWELEGRDAIFFFPDMEASVSWEKELKLAAEAVKMKAEVDRLQAALGLRAERQHRSLNGKWA